jgi:TPP-dependent pyruvate/acetoin dehydrogenase alpha subunit
VSVVASFEVRYTQFLDETGKAAQALPAFASDVPALVDLYRWMVLMRTYDAKAVALQRTGQLGTYAQILGQEAIQVGIGSSMRSDDIFCMTYREQGAQLMRGVTMKDLFLYWSGDERGSATVEHAETSRSASRSPLTRHMPPAPRMRSSCDGKHGRWCVRLATAPPRKGISTRG